MRKAIKIRIYPSNNQIEELSDMGLNIRHWNCVCGAKHDRDINAAINIKSEGIKALIAKGASRHPRLWRTCKT